MRRTTTAVFMGFLLAITPMSIGATQSAPVVPRSAALTPINGLSNPKLARGLTFKVKKHKIPRILTLKSYTLNNDPVSSKDIATRISLNARQKSIVTQQFLRFPSPRKVELEPDQPAAPLDMSKAQAVQAVPKPQPVQSQPGPKEPEPPKPQPQDPKAPGTIYTVKPGDQLGLIAYEYNTTIAEIMRLNNLSSPDVIWAGQKLTVQGSPRVLPDPYQNSSATKGGSAVAAHWDYVNANFPIGTKATVTDLATGISYQVVRFSGYLHADVEPATAADTANMKRIYNDRWSWAFRPVVVTVNGHRFAASINGMPHDIQSNYNNNFPGHSCIHFLGSKNHFNQQEEPNHQANVLRAVGK